MTCGKPDVTVLIVGYYSQEFLPSCLTALERASAGLNSEILFIDNGDGESDALVRQLCPAARIVPGQGNIGFGAANNLLAKQAQGRWLLLLNPDTEIEPGAIGYLLEAARTHPEFGILGGMTVTDRNTGSLLPPLSPPGPGTAIRGMFGAARQQWKLSGSEQLVPVQVTSGGFMLVERDVWRRLGGFDERFFLYGEDFDLCTRARNIGVGVGIVPGAKAFHAIGSGAPYSPQRLTSQMRGNATYVRKHYRQPSGTLVLALLWLSVCVRLFGAMLLQLGSEHYRRMFRGYVPLAFKPQRWFAGYSDTKCAERARDRDFRT